MSIRNPHLSAFKGALVKLKQCPRPVRDGNPDLQIFCESLETILRQGLKRGYSLFGLYKRDYWNWIETLEPYIPNTKPCPLYSIAIDACKTCAKIKTSQGRGRMFIRIALNKKFLSTTIEALIKDDQLLQSGIRPEGTSSNGKVYQCSRPVDGSAFVMLRQYWYDYQTSILGNELLVESFSSLLLLLDDIRFELNFKNTSFLDDTWRLPVVKQYQLVPSKDLGVKVSYVKNRAIVTDIDPGGLGADERKIEVGDVLDELYGESLLGAQRGKISRLLAIHEGYPIYLTVVKCHLPSGKIFYPLKEMYQVIKKNNPNFVIPQDHDPSDRGSEASSDDLENMQSISGSAFYKVRYIGKVFTGEHLTPVPLQSERSVTSSKQSVTSNLNVFSPKFNKRGGTAVIEEAVKKVLDDSSLQHDSKDEDYIMEIAETNVITRNPTTESLLFKHCFPEIASCGRRLDNMEHFAYVAGDTTCSISKKFSCYVFKAQNADESKVILRSIADGFGRTSWAV